MLPHRLHSWTERTLFLRRAFFVQCQLMSSLRPGVQSGIAAAEHKPFFCTDTEVETCARSTRTCVRRQLVSSLRPGVRSLTESSCGNTLPKSAPQSVKYTGEHACGSARGMLRYQVEGAIDGVSCGKTLPKSASQSSSTPAMTDRDVSAPFSSQLYLAESSCGNTPSRTDNKGAR